MVQLPAVLEKFILHWGEMGARWGINRTVAQVQALLYVTPRPIHAEEIAQTLHVARSNISTSLRELQAWGLVKVVHVLGDRRDHFQTSKNCWEMFQVIIEERKRREVDPTVAVLRECVAECRDSSEIDAHSQEQLEELLDLFEMTTAWYEQVRSLPKSMTTKLLKMGDRMSRFLETAS